MSKNPFKKALGSIKRRITRTEIERISILEERLSDLEKKANNITEARLWRLLVFLAKYNFLTNQILYQRDLEQKQPDPEFNPKVSIVIPVYNGSNYLASAIDSAMNQTYDNFEIIVVNDGSAQEETDKIEQILDSYKDSQKVLYYTKPNGGVSSALNYGITKMTGDYFAWLSHDDLFYPNHLEAHIKHLSRCKDRDSIITYTSFEVIDSDGVLMLYETADNAFYSYDWKVSITERNALLYLGEINGGNILMHRTVFDKVGGFNESLRISQEREMWSRCTPSFSFINIPIMTYAMRFHTKTVTNTNANILKETIEKNIEIIKKTPKETMIALYGSELNFYATIMGKYHHDIEAFEEILDFLQERIYEVIDDGVETVI